MSFIHLWGCLIGVVLCGGFSSQDKTPDVHVTCVVSQACVLPCTFSSSQLQLLRWFRQDSLVYSFSPDQDQDQDQDEDQDQDLDQDQVLSGRASVSAAGVLKGDASLQLRNSAPSDRGRYRCNVHTAEGEHNAFVIVKVEAPIQDLSVELSRLSGYEEMKCTVRQVFPPPRITWSTEPPTFHELRPLTRKQSDSGGLYMVDSRLRTLSGQPDLIYICNATSPYGASRSASHRYREIRGYEGKDLTIPCLAPSYLSSQTLTWNFSTSEEPKHILTYKLQSGLRSADPDWEGHAELDQYRIQFGDGSLRLMDPGEDHSGTYTCEFSGKFSVHTERSEVTISGPGRRSAPEEKSYWWVMGLVVAVLILALVAMLVYLKMRGAASKPRADPEEATELHPVKDSSGDSPLSSGGNNGQSASALT